MTTSPVLSITDELLAEILLDCEDSELYQFGEYHVALPTARVAALIAHIRSLTARMSYIERNFVGATFDYDGDGMAAMVVRISDRVSVSRDAAAVLDAGIAQEGADHE